MSNAEPEAPPRTAWAIVALLWLCGMGAGLQFAKASVAFGALAEHYQASSALAGWLLSAVGVVGVLFGATAGLIVGRLGRRRSLLAALALASILSLAQATLPPMAVFLACRVLEGAAHLAIIVAAPVCLPPVTAARHRAFVMGLWGTFFSVAFLAAGVVGPPILDGFGLSGLFMAHAAFMALLALAVFAFVRPDAARETAPAGAAAASSETIFRQHADVYSNPRTAIPALCFLSYTGMFLALQTLTPTLAPVEDRRWLVIGMPLVSIVTTLGAGAIVQYLMSPFRLAAWAFAAVILSTLLLHWAVASGAGILPVGLTRMAFVSLLPGAVYPMIPILCGGPAMQARAYGAIAQLGNVGSVLGPPIFAGCFSALGPVGLMAPAITLSACGAAIASFAIRKFDAAREPLAERA